MASDKSIHVGNSDNSVFAVDDFCHLPAYGDTGDFLISDVVSFGYDVAANPVVEIYADCLTDGLVVPTIINAAGI